LRGMENLVGFLLFFTLLASLFYITSDALFTYLVTLNRAQKELLFNSLLKESVRYYGYCDGNTLRLYYLGGVPEYTVRLVCIDYNVDNVGGNTVCLVPIKESGATVVDVLHPAARPLQTPVEYNILACDPPGAWAEDCIRGRLVCYAAGKVRAYPFVPARVT